jgi:hypothetical protein
MAASYSKRDVNRYSKTYAYVRQAPRFEYQIPSSLVDRSVADSKSMEFATLSFEGGNIVHFDFEKQYASAPVVLVTPSEESMNLYVESVNKTQAVIRSSIDTVGFAHVHVITAESGNLVDTSALSISKKVDASRLSKLYGYLRKSPSFSYQLDSTNISSVKVDPPNVERVAISFGGSNSITYTFSGTYSNTPAVILSADDSFNVFISSVNSTQVVVEASIENNNTAFIQVISLD